MNALLDERRAGVLLHPTSLPGPGYCGAFDQNARRFVDLIASAGLQIWQVLPLGPTHEDGCPYQSFSVHAGNPDLIDLEWLCEQGWLTVNEFVQGNASKTDKRRMLDAACARFLAQREEIPDAPMCGAYRDFIERSAFWLEDYARFHAFRDELGKRPWTDWPKALRDRDEHACAQRAQALSGKLEAIRFRQFVFQQQWRELSEYARERGILLFGDMPIYVHLESADVWAHQSLFNLDANGQPTTVTGVPPDYFCAEGQLWGNPQYDWQRMQDTGFQWWLQRFASAAEQFDIVRIDHFRALQAYWEIAATADTARDGHWVEAPGRALLKCVREKFPDLCLVAENLGTIDDKVETLRRDFDLPGMLILQFAFDGNPDNPYLSHRHNSNEVVYTGTHDNDTTLGWFDSLDDEVRDNIYRYFDSPEDTMPWMLIQQAMASPANTAIVPWQDFLGLGGQHRMNTPGTMAGNWQWRFSWEQVPEGLEQRLRDLISRHDRAPRTRRANSPTYSLGPAA